VKATVQEYQAIGITKVADGEYRAILQANPVVVTREGMDGKTVTEHEVDIYKTGIIYVASEAKAQAYLEANFDAVVAELASEETKQEAATAGERAQENLDATDYKIVKCAELGLDVETTYPGLKAQRAAWRELVNAAR